MSSKFRRAVAITCAVGAALGAGACAAVSGLDALEVCRDATCAAGTDGGGDGATTTDGSTASDAGRDARRGGASLPCGSDTLVCTSPNLCCLGATPTCAPACSDGTPSLACERAADCRGEGLVCCGQSLTSFDGGTPTTFCTSQACRGRILCDPNATNTCGTDTCGGTVTVGGQTLHYCN